MCSPCRPRCGRLELDGNSAGSEPVLGTGARWSGSERGAASGPNKAAARRRGGVGSDSTGTVDPGQRNALSRLVFASVELADDWVVAVVPQADFAPFFVVAASEDGPVEDKANGAAGAAPSTEVLNGRKRRGSVPHPPASAVPPRSPSPTCGRPVWSKERLAATGPRGPSCRPSGGPRRPPSPSGLACGRQRPSSACPGRRSAASSSASVAVRRRRVGSIPRIASTDPGGRGAAGCGDAGAPFASRSTVRSGCRCPTSSGVPSSAPTGASVHGPTAPPPAGTPVAPGCRPGGRTP